MKQVVKKVLPMLALLVLVGAGCSNVKTETQTTDQTQPTTQTQTTNNKVAAMDCKTDETCADKVWADCQAGGSFAFVMNGLNMVNVTVTGKQGTGCMVDWAYSEDYLKTAGAAGDLFRGKSMSCNINSTDKSAMSGFGAFVDAQSKADVNFKDCSGVLKDTLLHPTGPATLVD
jgi:hypothetical protein